MVSQLFDGFCIFLSPKSLVLYNRKEKPQQVTQAFKLLQDYPLCYLLNNFGAFRKLKSLCRIIQYSGCVPRQDTLCMDSEFSGWSLQFVTGLAQWAAEPQLNLWCPLILRAGHAGDTPGEPGWDSSSPEQIYPN